MQKKLIVAALAGMVAAPFAAQAQSSVEVYGILGVGYKAVENTAEFATKVKTKTTETGAQGQNSGSRLGFRGTEDLGNGLKAGFTVEYGIDPTENRSLGGAGSVNKFSSTPSATSTLPGDAHTSLATRQAFVSLSGGFGEVRIGRQNGLNKNINDTFTAFGGAGFDTGLSTVANKSFGTNNGATQNDAKTALTGVGNGFKNATDRQDNTIQYTTPKFSGFSASVQLVNEKTDKDTLGGEVKTQSGNRIGLSYAEGPLAVSYARASIKYANEETVAADGKQAQSDYTTDSLGASYDFGAAKLYLVHNRESYEKTGGAAATGTFSGEYKKRDTVVGVRVPFGTTSVWAQYGKGTDKNNDGTVDSDIKGYQLGVAHSLSKRTMAFAFYGDDENKQKTGGSNKVSNNGYTIGLQHNF